MVIALAIRNEIATATSTATPSAVIRSPRTALIASWSSGGRAARVRTTPSMAALRKIASATTVLPPGQLLDGALELEGVAHGPPALLDVGERHPLGVFRRDELAAVVEHPGREPLLGGRVERFLGPPLALDSELVHELGSASRRDLAEALVGGLLARLRDQQVGEPGGDQGDPANAKAR